MREGPAERRFGSDGNRALEGLASREGRPERRRPGATTGSGERRREAHFCGESTSRVPGRGEHRGVGPRGLGRRGRRGQRDQRTSDDQGPRQAVRPRPRRRRRPLPPGTSHDPTSETFAPGERVAFWGITTHRIFSSAPFLEGIGLPAVPGRSSRSRRAVPRSPLLTQGREVGQVRVGGRPVAPPPSINSTRTDNHVRGIRRQGPSGERSSTAPLRSTETGPSSETAITVENGSS